MILLPDHPEGKYQDLIAITEKTSDLFFTQVTMKNMSNKLEKM